STLKQTQPSDPSPAADGLPVPSVEPPVPEQLPEIHDLLPAIEPEESHESLASGSVESTEHLDEGLPDNKQLDREPLSEQSVAQDAQAAFATDADNSSATLQEMADVPVVESARRVSNQAASHQEVINQEVFELEVFEPEVFEPESSHQEMDATEGVTLFSFDIVEHSQTEVSESRVDTGDSVLEPVDSDAAADISSSKAAANTPDGRNPWLEAQQSKSSLMEPETLLTKSGTVKLLFKLKPGNFHGYIAPEDGSKDILFHQKYINAEVFEDLERGQRVIVTAKQLEGKVYATHVDLLQE
ncbi:MAG: cold shock domain-containing protein, partial [Cyanobacteria bacterium J06650_10]